MAASRLNLAGIFLAFPLLFGLCSCRKAASPSHSESNPENSPRKMSVVATMFAEFDFARSVAGDRADVSMLLPPGAEPHTFEPSPRDIRRISESDILICTGGENDVWLEGVLAGMGRRPEVLRLTDCVELAEERILEGMEAESDGGPDEHVWTSPRNAIYIVESLRDEFCRIDSANAEAYHMNAAGLVRELEELDSLFEKAVAESARKILVFGDRFPFRYFADEFGLECYAAFPGCSADVEASARTVKFLIDKIRQERIPVVLSIEFSSGKIADTLCEATGARRMEFHSCHNVTADEFSSGETYLSLMKKNLESLKEALR